MKKTEAVQWYAYMYDHNMKDFESYYNTYKQWFDANVLDPIYTFATTTGCVPPSSIKKEYYQEQKGNNPMRVMDYETGCVTNLPATNGALAISVSSAPAAPVPEDKQRKYLINRAHDLKCNKCDELCIQFFIDEPDDPKTAQELADRLKAGLFTVDLKIDDDEYNPNFYWRDAFSWRTPETQKNQKGYDAAMKDFLKFYEDILDTINIVSPVDGLAALQKIKDWKPSTV